MHPFNFLIYCVSITSLLYQDILSSSSLTSDDGNALRRLCTIPVVEEGLSEDVVVVSEAELFEGWSVEGGGDDTEVRVHTESD